MRDMEWLVSPEQVDYAAAVSFMESRVSAIREGKEGDLIWLLEHPPLYTAGTSARKEDLLDLRFPVYETGRGGQYTYHGPGQRVAYLMMDLKRRQSQPDVRAYVRSLEEWVIRALGDFGIKGERRAGRVGIWVTAENGGAESKIAAIGIRIRHWVAYHGVAVNIHPDLQHFEGIVPCGLRGHGVTSCQALGIHIDLPDFDKALKRWSAIPGSKV